MAENLTQFVFSLTKDPQVLARFQQDPDGAMKEAGLSAAEQAVLRSRNPGLIRDALELNLQALMSQLQASNWHGGQGPDLQESAQPERFTQFVLRLAEDPQVLARFQRDPDGAMKEASLSPAEQAVLRSRDSKLIRDALMLDKGWLDPRNSHPINHVIVLCIQADQLGQVTSSPHR